MVYNEQKLESFSRRAFKYEEQKIKDTHQAIRDAIDKHFDKNAIKEKYGLGLVPKLDVYLQGSYKNSTNVTKSSDVDLVVQMETIWRANKDSLPPDQLAKYDASYVSVSYKFADFNVAIFHALQADFGVENVTNDNKCLKIKEHGKYCNADVIPCFTYREYGYFENVNNQDFTEGMYFVTNDGRFVRNFPKQHYEALTRKSDASDGNFKETVRMFKNIRDDLMDRNLLNQGVANSYFIENMLFRVPVTYFSGTYSDRFINILDYLVVMYNTRQLQQFKCANEIDVLISDTNWKPEHVYQFLLALNNVRNETEF